MSVEISVYRQVNRHLNRQSSVVYGSFDISIVVYGFFDKPIVVYGSFETCIVVYGSFDISIVVYGSFETCIVVCGSFDTSIDLSDISIYEIDLPTEPNTTEPFLQFLQIDMSKGK